MCKQTIDVLLNCLRYTAIHGTIWPWLILKSIVRNRTVSSFNCVYLQNVFTNHIFYIYVKIYNLALNNQQWLICHKAKTNQTNSLTFRYEINALTCFNGNKSIQNTKFYFFLKCQKCKIQHFCCIQKVCAALFKNLMEYSFISITLRSTLIRRGSYC